MHRFDDPLDPSPRPKEGCVCGRHGSRLEHDHAGEVALRWVAAETAGRRYDGVLAAAVLRARFTARKA